MNTLKSLVQTFQQTHIRTIVLATMACVLGGSGISADEGLDCTMGTSGTNTDPAIKVPSDAEGWELLPKTVSGGGQPLPIWARAVAVHLPRTAAAMLKLDYAQRTASPVNPILRAKMRPA